MTTIETTRVRLIAALDALKLQNEAAGMMYPSNGLAEIERGRTKLFEAQSVLADHIPEVQVIFRASNSLDCEIAALDQESMVSAVIHGGLAQVEDVP